MKRLPRLFILLMLAFGLAGCVWLRLLELRNQLTQFDNNFAIEASDRFTLIFRNPVILDEDFVQLAKMQPTAKQPMPEGSRWVQAFRKLDGQGKVLSGHDFFFTLDFDKDNRLIRWDFSPRFMAMVPAQFFEASIRSLAKGRVDDSTRKYKVDQRDWARITVKRPTTEKIVAALGQPIAKSEEDGKRVYHYRFLVDTPYVDPDYQERRFSDVKLFFDKQTNELIKMGGRFIGLKVAIYLLRPGETKQSDKVAGNP